MTISVKLVEMLGGHLQLKSELGKGSTFSFSIPAEVVQLNQSTPEPSDKAQPFQGHILLVEDNQTNQMLMSAILKKQGLTFDIARDGVEAVEAVQHKEYDLVLMDENMPNMNGIEATRHIRKLAYIGESLPIIALTANAMTGDRERFLRAGMNEYLAKPLNLRELKRVLRKFLQE